MDGPIAVHDLIIVYRPIASGVAIGGSAGSRNRGPRPLGAPDRGHNLFYLEDAENQDSEETEIRSLAFSKTFLFCNILSGLIYIWNDMYEIMCKHFRREHSCSLRVFLCALVSRFVCERSCAQLIGNINCR